MKTAVEKFNALNGQVATRKELEEIAELGKMQGQINITNRIEKILNAFEHDDFEINLAKREMDRVPKECLPGMECMEPDEEFEGLEKAVSPDDIYQMITDKMLDKLKEASGKGYKKKWKTQNEEGYLIPFNFDSKKPYRGINMVLLTNGMSQVLKNPYFLTFKQIQKNKGKLKKGSKGSPVIYFTMLYSVSETNKNGENIEFGTYNKKKYLAWLKKNINRLKYSLDYYKDSYIPILKYYKVFNGHDIEGIDFDLENFKIGYQNGSEIVKNNDSRVEIADLIIANYPKPQPLLKDSKKGKAQYMFNSFGLVDEIHMPKFEDFETGLDYYRTLFHEFTHSTGSVRRLKRTMGGNFGSKPYAKEELIAEFGAVFLSAHAGIMWYNQSNHAEYLKNWNNALTHIKDDNRFIMRAASKAQEAADFILNYDKEGVPAYQNSLKSELNKEKPKKKTVKKKKAKAGEQLGLFGSKGEIKVSTNALKEMKVSELRKFTLDYYKKFLEGKELAIKNSLKKVEFTTKGGRKIAYGGPMYSAKAVVLDHLEELVRDSTYNNWGDRKANDKKDVLGYLNFKSKLEIDGEKRHVRISIVVFKNRKTLLKNFDIGKKKSEKLPKGSKRLPSDGGSKSPSKNKDTKKSNSKKKGLKQPLEPQPKPETKPEPQQPLPEVVEEKPEPVGNPNSLAARMQRNQNRTVEYYNIENPDIAKFLGQVEIKEKESVGISITAPQGAGKTRFAFQLINAFAKNYKVGHASMEEHPESSLYTNKAVEYIDPKNFANIEAPDINALSDIEKLIQNNDVIVIDSFEKLREIDKHIQVDQDFRKKYDGKLFIFIFQLTSDGKMRGGSKSQFDVDIVLLTEKFDDYRENYIYPDKNRYNSIPPSELKFSIYNRALVPTDRALVPTEGEPESTPKTDETPEFDTGNLIFTPVD
jgi:antirestriction protein ArdC